MAIVPLATFNVAFSGATELAVQNPETGDLCAITLTAPQQTALAAIGVADMNGGVETFQLYTRSTDSVMVVNTTTQKKYLATGLVAQSITDLGSISVPAIVAP
jgi:hypothetical protein